MCAMAILIAIVHMALVDRVREEWSESGMRGGFDDRGVELGGCALRSVGVQKMRHQHRARCGPARTWRVRASSQCLGICAAAVRTHAPALCGTSPALRACRRPARRLAEGRRVFLHRLAPRDVLQLGRAQYQEQGRRCRGRRICGACSWVSASGGRCALGLRPGCAVGGRQACCRCSCCGRRHGQKGKDCRFVCRDHHVRAS